MGFKVYTTDDGRNMPIEYLAAGKITPQLGMALLQKEGKLDTAKGAEKPSYISMTERAEPCEDGEIIPVLRIGADVIWETTASADMTSVKPGAKVTISTDGMEVTATTGGAAEVISMTGTDVGSKVRVRFGVGCADCE